MPELSIVIPARNEMFLAKTVKDILSNIEGDTEIIITLDGEWSDPPIEQNPRVTVIYVPESIGQRAAMNRAAQLSMAKYIMKCDAHCAFDKGFDVKLMANIEDNWTVVPTMRNLHAFNWKCPDCNWSNYQSPTPEDDKGSLDENGNKIPTCPNCKKTNVFRDVVWIAKTNPQNNSYCFDSEPHFQYFGAYSKRPEGKGNITETMSLQGSCFMLTREKYFELNIADETFGSWGSQGIEVAVKTWLSGGRVIVNHNTWYAHMFRTQGGDFSFPYPMYGSQQEKAKSLVRDLFFNNKWDKQIYTISWLVEKFWPVPGWTDDQLKELKKNEFIPFSKDSKTVQSTRTSTPVIEIIDPLSKNINNIKKGIIYYTDNILDEKIMSACQKQLLKSQLPIVSISLKPINFCKNVVVPLERGYLTMFKQILIGLEVIDADIVFFAEHDILYDPSHFDFTPANNDLYYYNENVYHVSIDGKCVFYYAKRLSQICAFRKTLLTHYIHRVENTEMKLNELGQTHEFNNFIRGQGFEPGTHNREERVDDLKSSEWFSDIPSIDIKHGYNLTKPRWDISEFRHQRNCKGFKLTDEVPSWGKVEEVLKIFS
jgi:glycosyltransferase involved in cell wall biosynthesis